MAETAGGEGSATAGQPVQSKAAVLLGARQPVQVVTISVAPPGPGEVRLRMAAASLCHTDVTPIEGQYPMAGPLVLGHEGAGVVESVGQGVTSVAPGDHVLPSALHYCGACAGCRHATANVCSGMPIEALVGGTLGDGTTRFTYEGKPAYHFLGVSAFSEYTVVPETGLTKLPKEAPLDLVGLLACGVSTGMGAVMQTARIPPGVTVAVFGLGAVGLAAVEGAVRSQAARIVAVDINPDKEPLARKWGATDFVNPTEHDGTPVAQVILELTGGGVDYAFEFTGNPEVMRAAIDCTHIGWGQTIIAGVAPPGSTVPVDPSAHLHFGKVIRGTLIGGYKGRKDFPAVVHDFMAGKIRLADYVTHRMPLEQINEAIDLLKQGKSLRTVLTF